MKKLTLLLVFLTSVNFALSMDFSVGFNLGVSKPLGNFADISSLYGDCAKGTPYDKNVSIVDRSMNTPMYGELFLGTDLTKFLSLTVGINQIKYSIDGTKIVVGDPMENFNKPDKNWVSPWFKETNLKIGIYYRTSTYYMFSLSSGIEPQLSFISFNRFYYNSNAVPISYYVSEDMKRVDPGICFKVGLEYKLDKKTRASLNGEYSIIFTDYNHGALSTAYNCFPLDYYVNSKQLLVSIGLTYQLAD